MDTHMVSLQLFSCTYLMYTHMQSYNVLVLRLKPAQSTGSGNESSLPLLPAEALGSLLVHGSLAGLLW